MKTPISLKKEDGFTLIEIIAVLILLGILAAVAIPKYIDLQADAELRAVEAVKAELQARANMYYAQSVLGSASTPTGYDVGTYWTSTSEDLGADYSISNSTTTALTITVADSGNTYNIPFSATGGIVTFGTITAN